MIAFALWVGRLRRKRDTLLEDTIAENFITQ